MNCRRPERVEILTGLGKSLGFQGGSLNSWKLTLFLRRFRASNWPCQAPLCAWASSLLSFHGLIIMMTMTSFSMSWQLPQSQRRRRRTSSFEQRARENEREQKREQSVVRYRLRVRYPNEPWILFFFSCSIGKSTNCRTGSNPLCHARCDPPPGGQP